MLVYRTYQRRWQERDASSIRWQQRDVSSTRQGISSVRHGATDVSKTMAGSTSSGKSLRKFFICSMSLATIPSLSWSRYCRYLRAYAAFRKIGKILAFFFHSKITGINMRTATEIALHSGYAHQKRASLYFSSIEAARAASASASCLETICFRTSKSARLLAFLAISSFATRLGVGYWERVNICRCFVSKSPQQHPR